MMLRGRRFGNVFCASGARNFFGEGWLQTRLTRLRTRLANWDGSTLVTKTTTLEPRMEPAKGLGNMAIYPVTLQPKEFLPDCICGNPISRVTLNAVGLSGPGVGALLNTRRWQNWPRPFLVSFMSMGQNAEERKKELDYFVHTILLHKHDFISPFGFELNYSCPNVGLDQSELVREVQNHIDIAGIAGVPIVCKFNLMLSQEAARDIASHHGCSALCLTNTIPFGKMADRIDWKKHFGTDDPKKSPLAKYGGGGISGPPLLPLIREWIENFRATDKIFPIIAGGGVFSKKDALSLLQCGATAVFLGTVAIYRPWRVQGIIRAVNRYCEARDQKTQKGE